jgi:hypothetical protein
MTPTPTESPTVSPIASPTSPGAHCGCESCNLDAWNTIAGEPSCGARIEWLQAGGKTERAACEIVAQVEFREECGACNPQECPLRTTPRCGCQECEAVWDVRVDGHSCGARITWLQTSSLLEARFTEEEACLKVGVNEFPEVCGACACDGSTPVSTSPPTNAAVPRTTPAPTPNPTPGPTPLPTNNLTPLPTPPPTAVTTPSPTLSPTPAPTPGSTPLSTTDPFDFSSVIGTTGGMADLLPPKHIDPSLVFTRAIPTSKVRNRILNIEAHTFATSISPLAADFSGGPT